MRTPQQAVVDYLSLRRSLGFKLEKHEVCLREFVSFLKKRRTSRITTKLALQFAARHRGQQPAEWASRLSIVRGFACYRTGADPATEIPPHGLAVPHDYHLVLGSHSVHTSIEALKQAETRISEIHTRLVGQGRL